MKIGLFAVLLTCALMPAGFAATITMSPPDLQNKAPVKPSVKPPAPSSTSSAVPSPAPSPIPSKVLPQVQPPVRPAKIVAPPAPLPAKPKLAAQPKAPLQPHPPDGARPSPPSVAQAKPQPKVVAIAKAQTPQPKKKIEARAKADCPCDCPEKRKTRSADARPTPHPSIRRQYVQGYRYADAAPVRWRAWHGNVRTGAAGDGPPLRYEPEGLRIDDGGWTGGVGYAPEGGGGGGFVDGYGQVHFANGGSVQNGPTYNSYGQSFQSNPSQAGPFQPRLMGGFAPPGSH